MGSRLGLRQSVGRRFGATCAHTGRDKRDVFGGARQHDDQGRRIVWLVKKSLYGGKNAGRNWYMLLKDFLKSEGFEQCYCEPCVFVKKIGKDLLIIGAYVDDLVCLYSNEAQKDELYKAISDNSPHDNHRTSTSVDQDSS